MKLTSRQLRKIIQEEIKGIQEAGFGKYHTPAHKMNMASKLVQKAIKTLSGVEGTEDAKQRLIDADQAIQTAWGL